MKKQDLKQLQSIEIEILDEIVRICEEHNLTYFLIGGTLLGAIRHKGFIPWDDDLDIAMPRCDYDMFLEIASEELNKNYFLHSFQTDSEFFLPYSKVRKNCTLFEEPYMVNMDTHKGIFVDIFPLDNAKSQMSSFQKLQAYLFRKIRNLLWIKTVIPAQDSIGLRDRFVLFALKPFHAVQINKILQQLAAMNKKSDSSYFVNLGSQYGYKKQTIAKNKYFPVTKVEFEGKFYSAPHNSDYILTKIYGDYMELPPKEKRITHNPVRLEFDSRGEEAI